MKTLEEYDLMVLGYQMKIQLLDESYKKHRAMLDAKMAELDQERRSAGEASIAEQISAIEKHSSAGQDNKPLKKKRRKMSAAGRKAIAEAQRKRWAAIKGTEVPAPKRKLSKKGRAAIVAAAKKRWAAVREVNKVDHNGH